MIFTSFATALVTLQLQTVLSDTGYFWHITDFHWDHTYAGLDLSCSGDVETYGLYGDYWCDAPWSLINNSVESMKSLKKDVDFIIWTGDSTPHTSDDNVNFDIHDALVGNVTNLFKDVFPTVPVYATFGNHDYYPHNQFPPTGNLLYNRSFERWKDWINEDNKDTFLKGAYYTVKNEFGLRIVGLNTNIYYTANKQVNNSYPEDPADQLSWLDSVLQSAKSANEKVLITAHIPPGIMPTGNTPWFYDRYNTRMNEIVMKYTDQIVGMHHGHEHSDNFRVYHDEQGQGVIAEFCAPSVTPWRYKLPSGFVGPAHNPSFRLLKYNRTTGGLLDYTQYYMDLPEVNMKNMSEWKIEYNTRTDYGLLDLSPKSMANLVESMKNKLGSEFQSFFKFWTVNVDDTYQRDCDKKCHARFYCNFRHLNKERFQKCLDDILMVSAASNLKPDVYLFGYFITILLVLL